MENKIRVSSDKAVRNSSLELLRILAMLAIIAHHYVVNSTVAEKFVYDDISTNQWFLEIWGMWGKTAINSFILISGYFMCRMQLTLKRYCKLLIQILFYSLTILLLFGIFDYAPVTVKGLFKTTFSLFRTINGNFVASFMVFYAFVPIYNRLLETLDKRQLGLMVLGLLLVMTVTSTFFFSNTMNEPIWYMTLYFVASYIRLYPSRLSESLKVSAWMLVISVVLAISTVLVALYLSQETGMYIFQLRRWHFVSDSNKLLAFAVGLSSFLLAKNLPAFHNKFINTLSAGTFGVLLIHASSNTMRRWLWQDVCDVPGMFNAEFPVLLIHVLITPLIIFSVCSFIDFFYRRYIERFFLSILFKPKQKVLEG